MKKIMETGPSKGICIEPAFANMVEIDFDKMKETLNLYEQRRYKYLEDIPRFT